MSKSPQVRVCVVGLGYVGLSLCRALVGAGMPVVGMDNDRRKVDALRNGESTNSDVSGDDLSRMLGAGFEVSADVEVFSRASVIVLALPTPVDDRRQPDLRPLLKGVHSISQHLGDSKPLVVIESTVGPGTTEDVILPALERNGKRLGVDFLLAFSPERVNPGSTDGRPEVIPKIVAGVDKESLERALAFYHQGGFAVVPARSVREAEAAKLLENTYRAVNLALVNELAPGLAQIGIDIGEVIRLAATKPFGFQAFYPGAGVGGHCIPIDPWYLDSAITGAGGVSRITRLAMLVNDDTPRIVADRIAQIVGPPSEDSSSPGGDILVLGMTYKPDVGDFRESPGPRVVLALHDRGYRVGYHDPYLSGFLPVLNGLPREENLESAARRYRLIVVLQSHREYSHLAESRAEGLVWVSHGAGHSVPSIWTIESSPQVPVGTL